MLEEIAFYGQDASKAKIKRSKFGIPKFASKDVLEAITNRKQQSTHKIHDNLYKKQKEDLNKSIQEMKRSMELGYSDEKEMTRAEKKYKIIKEKCMKFKQY